jgi:hypothetical protein
MTTAQQICDLARFPLNDADKERYQDPDLLGFLQSGLAILQRTRPDLFLGALGTPVATLALTDTLPTPVHVDQAIADYVTARATTLDTEDAERTAQFFQLSAGAL